MTPPFSLDDALFRAWTPRDDWHVRLSRPSVTHVAWQVEEVERVIARADDAARHGRYAVVVLSYEAAPAFDSALRTAPAPSPPSFPLAIVAEFDVTSAEPLPAPAPTAMTEPSVAPFWPSADVATFSEQVDAVQERIRAGDTYQVNLTFPLYGAAPPDVAAWFDALCQSQQAGYAARLTCGHLHLLSLSPELFFERRGETVTVKPMKGTCPRGRWLAEDEARASALVASAKARAENVMIVDLLRNDLGRVASTGSVHVPALFTLERYPTLWQLTSTVEATVPTHASLVDLLRALFPCGSVTGAPKVSTMGIIAELEQHPRGIYTGAIGLVRPGGDCAFSVAIRTVAVDTTDGSATLGVGAGITIDSDPQQEYDESLLKSRFLAGRPQSEVPTLLETLRLAEGQAVRLDGHLTRMRTSATFFGIPWDEDAVRNAVERTTRAHPSGTWRLRVTVDPTGHASASCSEYTVHHGEWRVAFANVPVDENDPLLCNKTTSRRPYETARRGRPDVDDVLLWNTKGEVTESTIANLVVELDGVKYTPPVTSGLLAGVLRSELVASGEVVERVLTRGMVGRAQRLWLVNSLRGWMDATLVR